jgi:hypothetical protein
MFMMPSNNFFVSIDVPGFKSFIVNLTHLIEHHLHRLTFHLIQIKKQRRLPIAQ